MNLTLAIFSFIITGYIRFWSINKAFPGSSKKYRIMRQSISSVIFIITFLFSYQYILTRLNIPNYHIISQITRQTILLYTSYCWIWSLIIIFIQKKLKQNKTKYNKLKYNKILTTLLSSVLLIILTFITVTIFWNFLWVSSTILFLTISAYWEELLKYISAKNISLFHKTTKTDIIFFAMLIWLTFSRIENIIFFIQQTISNTTSSIATTSTISRGLTSSLIHIMATGFIAYTNVRLKQKSSLILTTIISITIWISIHTIFNISLFKNYTTLTILLIISWYFAITFLLYQTNIFYTPKKN